MQILENYSNEFQNTFGYDKSAVLIKAFNHVNSMFEKQTESIHFY